MSGLFGGFLKKETLQVPEQDNPVPVPAPAPGRDELVELKERVHLGASRMRPHYIGNVMSALYYLCDADTERAQETILTLFAYLRQNVEGISRLELLPFPWELNHAKSYATLEKLRFEDRLRVEYSIDVEDFELPPITLQPLVENAIKHGLAPLEKACTIVISTHRRMDGRIELQVTDDGAGFDPAILKDPEKEEKSLACIRRRLAREVGGEMQIDSVPGQGTTVTIILPPKK